MREKARVGELGTGRGNTYGPWPGPSVTLFTPLMSLGEAGNTARLHLEAGRSAMASVAVNSLGLLDLVQIAAAGLAPKSQYQVYLAESNHPPFGKLEALAILKTNPDGAGIVQSIGPLKALRGETLVPP